MSLTAGDVCEDACVSDEDRDVCEDVGAAEEDGDVCEDDCDVGADDPHDASASATTRMTRAASPRCAAKAPGWPRWRGLPDIATHSSAHDGTRASVTI